MTKQAKRPSQCLLGKKIGSGWLVSEHLPKRNQEYGNYSECYIVKKNEETAFLKAVDLHDPIIKVSQDVFKEIQKITSRANNEKEIAKLCSSFRMKNVVRFIEAGDFLENDMVPLNLVHYIIYELAIGDGTTLINGFGGNIGNGEIGQRLALLHNVSNAVRTMHEKDIAHQDLKPSNVMAFIKLAKQKIYKLGDFDCAKKKSGQTLADELAEQEDNYAGTYRYAPIELLYGHIDTKWEIVRKGTDFYLLGSLIFFYFTGRHITAMYKDLLYRPMLWERIENQGKFLDYLPQIENAFELCIDELSSSTNYNIHLSNTLCDLVRYLCHPNPQKRGRPIYQGATEYKLTLIPVVSKLGNIQNYFKGL